MILPPDSSPDGRAFVAAYDYASEDGTVAFQHVRYSVTGGRGKDFCYRHRPTSATQRTARDGWVYAKPVGADDLLFWAGKLRPGEPLYWTEGEKDALAVAAAGGVAVSHHGGAGKVSAGQAAAVARQRVSVILVADADPSGVKDADVRYRLLLAAGQRPGDVRIVTSAVDDVGADASDHLAKYALGDLVELSPDVVREQARAVSTEELRRDGYAPDAPQPTYDARTGEYDLSGNIRAPLLLVHSEGRPLGRAGSGRALPDEADDQEDDRKPKPVDWVAFWSTDPEPVHYLVPPVLAASEVTRIYSPAKVGKSLLSIEMAAGLATGGKVLGERLTRIVVLYVDQENTQEDWKRILSNMGYGRDSDLSALVWFSLESWPPLDSPAGGTRLVAAVRASQAQVVFLDTQSKLLTGEEDKAPTSAAFYRYTLLPLKRLGVAVVIQDHAGNDPDRPRGSSGKRDDVDTIWQLLGDGGKNRLRLTRTHSRKSHAVDLLLLDRVDEPTLRHEIRVAVTEYDLQKLDESVNEIVGWIVALRLAPDASTRTIRTALRDAGHSFRQSTGGQAIARWREQQADA